MAQTYLEKMVSTPDGMRRYQRARAVEDVTDIICELMEKQGVTRGELARRLDTTPGWITQLLDGEKNKTVATLSDVFFALGRAIAFGDAPIGLGECRMVSGPSLTFQTCSIGDSQFAQYLTTPTKLVARNECSIEASEVAPSRIIAA